MVPETDGVIGPLLATQTARWTEQVSLACMEGGGCGQYSQ